MERRKIRRKRIRFRISLDPGAWTAFTGDLTPGGLFVSSARVHPPGTRVRLVVRLPDGDAHGEGVVRWAKRVPAAFLSHVRGGMGIQFTGLSPALQAFLLGAETGEPEGG